MRPDVTMAHCCSNSNVGSLDEDIFGFEELSPSQFLCPGSQPCGCFKSIVYTDSDIKKFQDQAQQTESSEGPTAAVSNQPMDKGVQTDDSCFVDSGLRLDQVM